MQKILLDTDIGGDIDDAICLAYLLKEPQCDLLGITTVCGEPEKRAAVADAICRAVQKTAPGAVLLALSGSEMVGAAKAIGLPVDYIGLIVAVDRLFDMGRTCLNVTGDIACSVCVTKWESRKVSTRK